VIQVNKQTTYIIVAVVIVIIIVAGVGAYLLSRPSKTTPTTTPAPTTTPVSVASATTLSFAANATTSGVTSTLNFAGENIGTSNLTIRVDYPASSLSYVLNYGTQQSWSSTNSGTTWTLDPSFSSDNSTWGARWTGEYSALLNWNGVGTTYTYTTTTSSGNTTVLVYNIEVNPTLPASTFATS